MLLLKLAVNFLLGAEDPS